MATNNGHLNTRTRDEDSHVTGFGQHARVVAFCPSGRVLECRIDRRPFGAGVDPDYPRLPDPTSAQILRVAKYHGDAPGRWVLDRIHDESQNGDHYWATFTRRA